MPKKCHSGLWLWDRQHTEQKWACPRPLSDTEARPCIDTGDLRKSPRDYPKVSPTKRWCHGPGRGSLFLSPCQCLGSASQPGFGSGPGPACLIEAPGGEKRGHPPTSWSQMQKVLFLRLILRRLILWTVDMDGIYEREKQKAERGGNDWNFITVNLLFIYRIIRADRNCDGAHGFTKDPWYERPWRPLSDWVTKKTQRTEAAHVKDFCTFLTKGGREGGNEQHN